MRGARTALLLPGLVAVSLLGTTADAFVPQRTGTGKSVKWKATRVFLTPDSETPATMSSEQFRQEIIRSAANWTDRNSGNSYLQITVDPTMETGPDADDYLNVVTFLKDCWGREESQGCVPFSPDAPALTFLVFVNNPSSSRYGEIVDADIELNAVDRRFNWGILTPGAESPGIIDLQNTLTHEIGHLIGLDHNCYTGSAQTVLDHDGKAIPSCRSPTPSSEIRDATMYAFTDLAETKKRAIEPDDVLGLWNTYPIASDPKSDARVVPVFGGKSTDDSGCAAVPAQRHGLSWPAVWIAAAAAMCLALGRRLGRRAVKKRP